MMPREELLTDATAGAYGRVVHLKNRGKKSFSARGTTTAGAGTATVKIWVTNVASPAVDSDLDWILAGTIALSFTTDADVGGFAFDAAWDKVRAELDAISGTNAAVDAEMVG